jgi:calcineurin-like phosphoesterase family protein
MIWFTSDWHFGHDREFIWKPRGFSSIEEHDNTIIAKHNGLVFDNDDVYVLGDLMLGNNEHGINCIKQLKGKLHIVRGNHDTDSRIALYSQLPQVVEICDAKYLRYGKYHFFLCHYPCITSNYDDSQKPLKQKTLNLCGHVHTTNQYAEMEKGYLSYHVEIDAHGGFPISFDMVIDSMKMKVEECKAFL